MLRNTGANRHLIRFCVMAAASVAVARPLSAQVEETSSGLRADVEVDPLAFGLGGYSLHVGLGAGRIRLDLGAFAADLPEFVHGNRGVDIRFDGFGGKLDVFLDEDWKGPFAGIEAGLVDVRMLSPDADYASERRFQFGVRAGWRIPIVSDFYVTPWIGLGYAVGAADRMLGDHPVKASPWIVFPTVHIGYRLR